MQSQLKKRVLICGGREFTDYVRLCSVMEYVSAWLHPEMCIIHGGARGADSLASRWAKEKGLPELRVDANWDFYGKKAGSIRNQWMLTYAMPDLVIAMPGGVGTQHMIAAAKKKGIDVYAC